MARRILCCVFGFALSATAASAAGYDDFADGMSAVNRGDNDRAIQLFTSALAAGDLSPNLVPVANYQLGIAHLRKGDCALAVADATSALHPNTNYLSALILRATAQLCTGNNAAAIQDYAQIAALKPNAVSYWMLGRVRWTSGDFAGASDDFSQSLKISDGANNSYYALWFIISRSRSGSLDDSTWKGLPSSINLDRWPGPLLKLFQGTMKPDDVDRAAGEGDTQTKASQRCEADFYEAEWRIYRSNAAAAKPLLEHARDACPKNLIEGPAAKQELEWLASQK